MRCVMSTGDVVLIGIGSTVIGALFGYSISGGIWQSRAVEAGAAEWRVTSSYGKTEFHWTTNPASAEK
jgi:hypothetical protein